MSKPRCNSLWRQLTPAQRETLEDWLLGQNLTYPEVLEKARKEWGITASLSSLGRCYQRLAHERMQANLAQAQATALAAQTSGLNLTTVLEAVLKLISRRLLDAVQEPGESRELPALANLLLQHQQQQIQRAWLGLAREKYEFKAARAALKALPLAGEMQQEELAREQERIERIKRALFGRELEAMEK